MRTTTSRMIAMAATTALAAVIFSAGAAAAATTPAQKCEAGKLKASGKYSSCMLAATAKSVTQGEAPDYSKCDSTVDKSWMSAEEKGEGMCPGGTADQTGLQAFLDACNTSVAEALGGAPLPLDVVNCNTDLAACTDALTVSEARPHWTCAQGYYGSDDGCDCGCGVIDPDCSGPGLAACAYCGNFGSCSESQGLDCPGIIDEDNNSTCRPWTCDPSYIGDGYCDCGCGIPDPDCADNTVGSCDYCDDIGSCSGPCPGQIDPADNSQCTP